MIGIILASIINFSNGLATTKTEYAQYQNMEMFTLDFTRIISTYRDLVGDVLIPPYPPNHAVDEINESYNRIQSYKNKPLFTDTVYSIKTIDSRSLNMTGTLN